MMLKRIYMIIMILSIGTLNAQQQNIELPDFVITGRQSADVLTAQKPKPELISILSKEFFTPQYSPEELPILISSDPVAILPDVKTSNEVFSGNLKVKLGKYSLPVGELNISQSYENYLFGAKLWGINTTEFIPNAGYNNSGFKMAHDFFVSTRSELLPGSRITVDATYWRDSYKMFGSLNPAQVRESNNGNANLIFSNNYSRFLNINFSLSGDLLSLNENNLKELGLKGNGLVELKMDQFSIGGQAEYTLQQFKNDLVASNSYSSFVSEGFIKVSPFSMLNLKGGLLFHTGSVDNFISPFASAEIQLAKGLVAGIEYKPRISFLTNRDFLADNLYAAVGVLPNCFTKYNTSFSGSLRYEFQKMFLADITLNYSKADNFIYYQDITNAGVFDILTLNDARLMKSKLTIQYHPGILGSVYSEFVYQESKDANDRYIPYQPKFISSLWYAYDFNFGLGIKFSYESCIGIYSDRINADELQDYHNISVSVSFELLKGIKITGDFQNILNRSNFAWKYYQRKPFDYLVGIDYRW